MVSAIWGSHKGIQEGTSKGGHIEPLYEPYMAVPTWQLLTWNCP